MPINDFERLPSAFGGGTSKVLSKSALTGDVWGGSAGDFLGRLMTLFGDLDGDGVTLWHRPSGHVITAYSAQSGPAYGGGVRYAGARPEAPIAVDFAAQAERQQRVAEAAERYERERPPGTADLTPRERFEAMLRGSGERERALTDVVAGEGFLAAVEELDRGIAAVEPKDHERIDGEADEGPLRVGFRDGEPFSEALSDDEALAYFFQQLREETVFVAYAATRLFSRLTQYEGTKGAEWQRELGKLWADLIDEIPGLEDAGERRRLWETLGEHAHLLELSPEAKSKHAASEPPAAD